MMRPITRLLLFVLCAAAGGCSQFGELHFFKTEVVDKNGQSTPGKANYYRLRVKGFSMLSSSRYVSGFFDSEIVDGYFNEIPQPESGRLKGENSSKSKERADPVPGLPQPPEKPDQESHGIQTTVITSLGREHVLARESLVLLLSTNADAIADQIGILTRTKESIDAIALLANKDKLDRLSSSDTSLQQEALVGTQLQQMGESLINGLTAEDAEAAKTRTLTYANVLARSLGATQQFTSLADVQTWLDGRRESILREGR